MTKKVARETSADSPDLDLAGLVARLADLRLELFGRGHVEAAGVLLAVEACLGGKHEREALGALEALATGQEKDRRREWQRTYLEDLKTSDPTEYARLVAMLRPGWDAKPSRGRKRAAFNCVHDELVRLVRDLRAKGVTDERIARNVIDSAARLLWPKVPRVSATSIDPASVVRADALAFVNAAYRALGEDPQNANGAERQRTYRATKARLHRKRAL